MPPRNCMGPESRAARRYAPCQGRPCKVSSSFQGNYVLLCLSRHYLKPTPRVSERKSERALHHARRPGRPRRAKTRVGLNAVGIKRHSSVDVGEIRTVEKIISLPPELKVPFLAQVKILEQRQICVEDRRQPDHIPWQVPDRP